MAIGNGVEFEAFEFVDPISNNAVAQFKDRYSITGVGFSVFA
jgi:hypothetical protein